MNTYNQEQPDCSECPYDGLPNCAFCKVQMRAEQAEQDVQSFASNQDCVNDEPIYESIFDWLMKRHKQMFVQLVGYEMILMVCMDEAQALIHHFKGMVLLNESLGDLPELREVVDCIDCGIKPSWLGDRYIIKVE